MECLLAIHQLDVKRETGEQEKGHAESHSPHGRTCTEPAALGPLIQSASRVGLGHLGVEEMLGHA